MKNNPRLCSVLSDGNQSILHYLQSSKMECDRVWATQVEIFATAHLLRTNIFVYTQIQGSSTFQWLKHAANFVENVNVPLYKCIYLNHNNANHYEVVLDVAAPTFNVPGNFIKGSQLYNEIEKQFQFSNKSEPVLQQENKNKEIQENKL